MQHIWAHARRGFEQARDGKPEAADAALALIGALYANEKAIRRGKLKGAAKLALRRERSVPAAARFFAWCRGQSARPDLLPRNPLAKALKYALDREAGLSVHLSDADVAIDTNHLYADIRFMPTPEAASLSDPASRSSDVGIKRLTGSRGTPALRRRVGRRPRERPSVSSGPSPVS